MSTLTTVNTNSCITLIPNSHNTNLHFLILLCRYRPYSLIISFSMGSLSFFLTCLLNSASPGGGCLFGITVMVSCCSLLDFVFVSTLGVSTSTRSSSQSELKHQNLLYFLMHSEQNSPVKSGLVTSPPITSQSV